MQQDDVRSGATRRALDLNNIRLSTVWRGFDPRDVDRFLQRAAGDYEWALRERERLQGQHAELDARISAYRQREREAAATLAAAKEAADAIKRQAQEQARRIDQQAEARAAEVVKPALIAQDKLRVQIQELAGSRRTIEHALQRSIDALRTRTAPVKPDATVRLKPEEVRLKPDTSVMEEARLKPDTTVMLEAMPSALPAETAPAAIAPSVDLPVPLKRPRQSSRWLGLAAVGTITAIAAFVVASQIWRRAPSTPSRPSLAASIAAAPAAPAPLARAEQPAGGQSRPTPPPSTPTEAQRPQGPRAQAPPATRRVVVAARRECWLRAIADDQALHEGLVRAGQEIVLEFRDTASIRAGDAGAVAITLDGQPLGALGGDGQVVTRRFAGRR